MKNFRVTVKEYNKRQFSKTVEVLAVIPRYFKDNATSYLDFFLVTDVNGKFETVAIHNCKFHSFVEEEKCKKQQSNK
ncbi:MAG: hypothetical protein KAX20_07010 [Candidatus Omnitrophica bacterium]|nr:hypothetical protein [Candidatus Omnitrophota bacterium]